MAATLNGFIESQGHSAIHLRDLSLDCATDVEWITYLHESREEWIIVTGDQRIRKNKAEAQAFRNAKLRGIVLDRAYQKTAMNRCCAVIVHQWPNLYDTIQRFDPPVLLEMGINFKGRFRQLGF